MAQRKASWESVLGVAIDNVQYGNGGETTPQYWMHLVKLPNPENLRRTHKDHELITVTCRSIIYNIDPSLQYVGFLGSYIGYGPQPSTDVIDLGANQIPSLGAGYSFNQVLDFSEYDPTALPVGGVTYPIWQRKTTDIVAVDHYLSPNENPGELVGLVYLQVMGSTTVNPAATVKSWMRYELQ